MTKTMTGDCSIDQGWNRRGKERIKKVQNGIDGTLCESDFKKGVRGYKIVNQGLSC